MEIADKTKLRAYFFGNMYISPIQHGIQAAHVVTKMAARYCNNYEATGDVFFDWADVGVTKILLNGGYHSNLEAVYAILEYLCPPLGLPFGKFHEEVDALNGALTSVGVVVPEEIYSFNCRVDYGRDSTMTLATRIGFRRCEPQDSYADMMDGITSSIHNICAFLTEMSTNSDDLSTGELMYLLHRTLKTARLA